MHTLSLSSFKHGNGHTRSFSEMLSRNPDLMRRLNKMTGSRIPMLRTASRRRTMSKGLPWIMVAGAAALIGAGIGFAMKRAGGSSLISRMKSGSKEGYAIDQKYPAGHASAGSVAAGKHTSPAM